MGNYHLKRLAVPETWQISRKGAKFVTKPAPGPHTLQIGIPLNVILKDVLNYAKTTREAKKILNAGELKVDGKVMKSFKHPVGLFDTIELTGINEFFRVILSKKGKIELVKIKKEEARLKPCKIIGKTMVKGKIQLNLYDGKNIFADKGQFKVGDTVLLSLPDKKIMKHSRLDKQVTIFLTSGKHIGETGSIEAVVGDKIIYKNLNGDLIETLKKYAFIIGDANSFIALG